MPRANIRPTARERPLQEEEVPVPQAGLAALTCDWPFACKHTRTHTHTRAHTPSPGTGTSSHGFKVLIRVQMQSVDGALSRVSGVHLREAAGPARLFPIFPSPPISALCTLPARRLMSPLSSSEPGRVCPTEPPSRPEPRVPLAVPPGAAAQGGDRPTSWSSGVHAACRPPLPPNAEGAPPECG